MSWLNFHMSWYKLALVYVTSHGHAKHNRVEFIKSKIKMIQSKFQRIEQFIRFLYLSAFNYQLIVHIRLNRLNIFGQLWLHSAHCCLYYTSNQFIYNIITNDNCFSCCILFGYNSSIFTFASTHTHTKVDRISHTR